MLIFYATQNSTLDASKTLTYDLMLLESTLQKTGIDKGFLNQI